MFSFKKFYFLIIQNTRDINIDDIKIYNKFIIIYRNQENKENISDLIKFRKRCKLKSIKFFIANNFGLASSVRSDGIYLSAHNKSLKSLNYKKNNFDVIGSAHNYNEISKKKKQGCKNIFLSRIFLVSYKTKQSFLGINKFNNHSLVFKGIIPLGGINFSTLNKLKMVKCEGFAILSEIKKKPAKIISRLF